MSADLQQQYNQGVVKYKMCPDFDDILYTVTMDLSNLYARTLAIGELRETIILRESCILIDNVSVSYFFINNPL